MSHILHLTEEQFRALGNKHRKPRSAPQSAPDAHAKADRWPLILRDQIVAAGLPEPYREFTWHSTRAWRLDLAWPHRHPPLACEVDGGVHRIKGRFLADIERHNAMMLAHWRWVRVTPRMVDTGEALQVVRELLT